MRDLFKSIAPCPYCSDEVTDVRKDEIRDGRLVAGDKLPTGVSLIGRFGISRSLTTHRQVLAFILTGHSALAGDPLHGASQEAIIGHVVARALAWVEPLLKQVLDELIHRLGRL